METPSSFIICYTPGGEMRGGTSQALRIAQAHNIPIYNLGNTNDIHIINEVFKTLNILQLITN